MFCNTSWVIPTGLHSILIEISAASVAAFMIWFIREIRRDLRRQPGVESRLRDLTTNLIDACESPFCYKASERENAANTLALLAGKFDFTLQALIKAAQRYVDNQLIDDASPYRPNCLEVLGQIRPPRKAAISFLKATSRHYRGIPRWEAIAALQHLDRHAAAIISRELKLEPYELRLIREMTSGDSWASRA